MFCSKSDTNMIPITFVVKRNLSYFFGLRIKKEKNKKLK